MALRIDPDHRRFRDIVRGKIKQNLKKYISNGELIGPKGKERIIPQKDRYVGIRRTGPESLRHFKRTFRQALQREIMSGKYDPQRPLIVPVREDRRYRSWKTIPLPQSNAVMIFIMDVS